jgi:hypothetical protein
MSSGKAWMMGLEMAAKQQESLKMQFRDKHLRMMKQRKEFSAIFGVGVDRFCNSVFVGFDIVKFDDFLMEKDEQYRKANTGELGEDVDCSMRAHLVNKYGQVAADMVRSFI